MSEPIVSFDENAIKSELREQVRQTAEDTLNGLLEEETYDRVGAECFERTAEREAYRAGHYDRKLVTTPGEVTVRMPKLKVVRFTTATANSAPEQRLLRPSPRAQSRVAPPRTSELRPACRCTRHPPNSRCCTAR